MSNRINVGDVCLLDQNGLLNLKEYDINLVRVMKKIFPNKFLCAPLSPVVFPISLDNHAVKYFVVHKSNLTKITDDNPNVVIRTPLNMPAFTHKDLDTINEVLNLLKDIGVTDKNSTMVNNLSGIKEKIAYIQEFNDVEGI